MPDQRTVDSSPVLACADGDPPASLDPQRYLYTPDDEQALRRLADKGQAHLVLCCCAEYVASCNQDRRLAARWGESQEQRRKRPESGENVPFFGGANDKGLKWQQHPANARALDIQLDERRGLVGILPASIGYIVFDADHNLLDDAERLTQLFGHAPIAIVASSQAERGHIWYKYKLPEGHNGRTTAVSVLDGQPRGEIRASKGLYSVVATSPNCWHS